MAPCWMCIPVTENNQERTPNTSLPSLELELTVEEAKALLAAVVNTPSTDKIAREQIEQQAKATARAVDKLQLAIAKNSNST